MKKYIKPNVKAFNVRLESHLAGGSITGNETEGFSADLTPDNEGNGSDACGKEDFDW